jgi:hypothetical protein
MQRKPKSDRNTWLGLGIFLIIMGTLTATAAVSLGTYNIAYGSAYSQTSYLVYSSAWILISLAFSFSGAYSFYRAGKSSSSKFVVARPKEIESVTQ